VPYAQRGLLSARQNPTASPENCQPSADMGLMSASGRHQRTCLSRNPTSVLPPRPDIADQTGHVGLVPTGGIRM